MRRLVPNDLAWMKDLAVRRFGPFDEIAAEGWMRNQVLTDHVLYLPIRTSDAFLIAGINAMPWALAEPTCLVLLLVTDQDAVWQGLQLLRASIEWAKVRKCVRWAYHWDAGDAGVLCRRVGATPGHPRYGIDLCRPQESPDPS